MLEYLAETDAFSILNHPNSILTPHYRREALLTKNSYQGMEIYNGSLIGKQGEATSTDKWDFVLSNGRKILGFANDDTHFSHQPGEGFNIVRAKSNTPEEIFSALKSGNFYASSGVIIDNIRRNANIIEIETKEAQEIRAVADGGRVIKKFMDNSTKMDVSGLNYLYVRFELYGKGAKMAWTQPFYL